MSWNESEILEARRAILDAAQDMLAGRLTYIEGARKIVAIWWRSKLDERDADFLPFVGIDSETEALPFGEMRAHWQPAALARDPNQNWFIAVSIERREHRARRG